jgi:hypothetical protein
MLPLPAISFSAWQRLSLQLARAWRRGCAPALRFWCTDPKVILSDIWPLFEIPVPFRLLKGYGFRAPFAYSTRNHRPPVIVVISEPIRQLRDYFDGRRQAIYTDQQTGSSSYFLVSRAILKGVH